MSEDISDPGHGNSPAAWTAVVIMLIAFVIGTAAFWFDAPNVVFGAAGLLIVGLIVGGVMTLMGYGVGGARIQAQDQSAQNR